MSSPADESDESGSARSPETIGQTPAVDDGHVAAPTVGDPVPGAVLHGRYAILRELGWGSLGRVYLVRDASRPAGDDTVALKVIRHDRLTPEAVAFLKAEFRALWGLRHPNVARVFDLDGIPSREELFFTLDYLPGRPLTEVVQERGWRPCLELFVQALRALAFVHARGLIHMDVKPKNVFVLGEPDGPLTVQLLDFHLAKERSAAGDRHMRGTVAYMAPEVIKGLPVDLRADLYSFGAVAYEALTGAAPFASAGSVMDVLRAQASQPPPSFAAVGCRGIPPALEAIVMRLLAKNPGERFPAASEVIRALSSAVGTPFELETEETRASYLRTARFVGRTRELGRLVAAGLRLKEAPHPIVLVAGEAGIGKSRFLGEVKVSLQLEGLPCILVRPSRVDASPFDPFLGALSELLRRIGREELLLAISRDGVIDPELLASRRGSELPERVRRTAALAELVRDVAEACPFALAVDDLQEADEGSLELVRALAAGPPLRALILLAVDEDDPRGQSLRDDLLATGSAELTSLNRLTRAETSQILAAMVNAEQAPAPFVDRMWEVSGGNPRFVEESMRSLAETGAIRTAEGALAIKEEAAELLLPEVDLGTITSQRVARLAPEAAGLLAAVAASPRPRPLPFAAAVAGLPMKVAEEALRMLERRGFVGLEPGDTAWSPVFIEHEPLRSAALFICGEEGARLLHRNAARLLESRHPVTSARPGSASESPGAVRDRDEELQHHLEQAGELKAALRYAARAGRAALSRREYLRARDALQRALLLFDSIERAEEEPSEDHLDLTLRLAEALGATGARAHAIELLLPLGSPFRSVAGLRLRGRMRKDQGELTLALADLEKAVAWAEEDVEHREEGAERERGRCLGERASVHLWRANYAAARADGEAARDVFEALLARRASGALAAELVAALDALHHACHFSGDEAAAATALRRGLEIQREHLPTEGHTLPAEAIDAEGVPVLGDAGGAHVPRSIQAVAFAHADRAGDLGAHYKRRARLLSGAGDLDGAAFARLNLAHLQRASGRLSEALRGYARARDTFERASNRVGLALTGLSRARLLAALGDGPGAAAEARAAEEVSARLGARWVEAQSRLALAEAAWAERDGDAAQTACVRAQALADELGNVPLQADLALFRAQLAEGLGELDAARRALEAFEASPLSTRSAPQRLRGRLVRARLLLAEGEGLKQAERLAGEVYGDAELRGLPNLAWSASFVRSQARRARGDAPGELADLVTALEALRRLTDGLPEPLRACVLCQPDSEAIRGRFAELRG